MTRYTAGDRVGRYQLRERLGAGGYGEVWRARLSGPQGFLREVAVKVIRLDGQGSEEVATRLATSLANEARLCGRLHHPNLVPVTDFGETDGSFFAVMELVPGISLRALLDRCAERGVPLPAGVALQIAGQVARGLRHAHELRGADGQPLGVVHRDLKPANVMLTREGLVKILDFGLARSLSNLERTRTADGAIRGTPRYLSPEQVRADGRIDGRSDLYALGLLLFELLMGRRLYRSGEIHALVYEITTRDFADDIEEAEGVAPGVGPLLTALLARDPADRPATAEEVDVALSTLSESHADSRELERFARALGEDEPGEPTARKLGTMTWPTTLDPGSRPASQEDPTPAKRPRRWWLAVAGLAVLAAVVGSVVAGRDAGGTVSEDPRVQRRYEESLAALYRADFERALADLAPVIEAEPTAPEPRLVAALASGGLARQEEAAEHLERGAEVARGAEGREAELLRMHFDRHGSAWTSAMLGLLDASPEDYLTIAFAAALCANCVEERPELFERLLEVEPDRAYGHFVVGRRYLDIGEPERAVATVEAGLEVEPGSATLLELLGRTQMILGRFEEARATFTEAITRPGAPHSARRHLATALLMVGAEQELALQRALLLGPTTPIEERLGFAQEHAQALLGRGRPEAGLELLDVAAELAEREGRFVDVFLTAWRGIEIRLDARIDEGLPEQVDLVRRAGAAPEYPSLVRRYALSGALVGDALVAASAGDTATAERLRQRLLSVEHRSSARTTLETELALRSRDAEACRSLETTSPETCRWRWTLGRCLQVAAADHEARALLAPVAGEELCLPYGPDRFYRADALLRLAELDAAAGDAEAARAGLEAWRQVWTAPEPDIDPVRRAEALEARVAAR